MCIENELDLQGITDRHELLKTLQYGDYIIEADREATIAAYLEYAGPHCKCGYCQNFRAAHHLVFTKERCAAFDTLGIDISKEIEVYHIPILPSEGPLMLYGGWYFFIGRIHQMSEELIQVDPEFSFSFRPNVDLLPEPLKELQCASLDILMRVPLVLNELGLRIG